MSQPQIINPLEEQFIRVVNNPEYAQVGLTILDILQRFEDSTVYANLYKDGTLDFGDINRNKDYVSTTREGILRFVYPKSKEEITFEDLRIWLEKVDNFLFQNKEFTEYNKHIWNDRWKAILFGVRKTSPPATKEEVTQSISDAKRLTIILLKLSKYKQRFILESPEETAKEFPLTNVVAPLGEESPSSSSPLKTTPSLTSSDTGEGDSPTKDVDAQQKVRKEVKEEPSIPENLEDLIISDRAFRQEVERIQSALIHSIASQYGLNPDKNPKEFLAFHQALTKHITPTVFTQLQSFSPTELQNFISSPGGKGSSRINLYIKTLVGLQYNPSFQAILEQQLHQLSQKKILISQTTRDQTKQTPEEIASYTDKVYWEHLTHDGLSKDEHISSVQEISNLHSFSANSLEKTLREVLHKEGLTENQINDLFTRLQASSILKKDSNRLTTAEIEEFAQSLILALKNEPITQQKFLHAFQNNKELLGLLFIKYMDALAYEAFTDSENIAAIYANPNLQPTQDKLLPHIEQLIKDTNGRIGDQSKGYKVVQLSLFLSQKKYLKEEGLKSLKLKFGDKISEQITQTQTELEKNGRRFAGRQNLLKYVMSQFWDTGEIQNFIHSNKEEWANETIFFQYFQTIDFESFDSIFSAPIYIDLPQELVLSGQSENFRGSPNQQQGILSDREVGKNTIRAALLFLGPEAVEAFNKVVEAIETTQAVLSRFGPLGEALNAEIEKQLQLFDLVGKIVKWAIGLGLAALLTSIIGGIIALQSMFQSLQGVLSGATLGSLNGLSSITTPLGGFLKSSINNALQASKIGAKALVNGASTFGSTIGTSISGTMIATVSTAVIGTIAVTHTTLILPFVTLRNGGEYSGYFGSNIPNLTGFEGCWPTTGVTGENISGYHNYKDGGEHYVFAPSGLIPGYNKETAIDIRASIGSPIYAPFSGVATYYPKGNGYHDFGTSFYPLGNYITLDTGNFVLLFAHLNDFANNASMNSVTNNIAVSAGQVIGRVGTTGRSTGPHLHYGYFSKNSGEDIISILPITLDVKKQILSNESIMFQQHADADTCAGGGGVK